MTACPPAETLVAWWARELRETEASSVDEHLFACDGCAAASERLARVVASLRTMIPFVISHAHRDRLVASGTRVRTTALEPSVTKPARFTPDVDLIVLALRADISSADRVDVEIVSPTGTPRYTLEDVPFDRANGEVLIACQRHFEGMFPGDPIFSVHAVEAGKRRVVGDYVARHEWR